MKLSNYIQNLKKRLIKGGKKTQQKGQKNSTMGAKKLIKGGKNSTKGAKKRKHRGTLRALIIVNWYKMSLISAKEAKMGIHWL